MPYKPHQPRAVIADFAKGLSEAVEQTRFTLFVCGPSPSRRTSAVLRHYVSRQIERNISGVTVVWGEHRDFRGQVGNIRLRKFSDVTKEMHFASNESDLVIIFPDSPGSFVELGMFGMHQKVCARLVVFLDERYRTRKSFIGAMGKLAKNQQATIKFVRYRDRRLVLRQIEAIMRTRQESKYRSSLYVTR